MEKKKKIWKGKDRKLGFVGGHEINRLFKKHLSKREETKEKKNGK